jgi:hypothetical protein
MTVRAKFRCESKKDMQTTIEKDGKWIPGICTAVHMYPVTGGSEENSIFGKATPSGQVDLTIFIPEAAAQFQVGKEYYVDFTEAPENTPPA